MFQTRRIVARVGEGRVFVIVDVVISEEKNVEIEMGLANPVKSRFGAFIDEYPRKSRATAQDEKRGGPRPHV